MDSSCSPSRGGNRRQDHQLDTDLMNSPTDDCVDQQTLQRQRSRTNLVFNTFRSHLSVLRASVSAEKADDHKNHHHCRKSPADMTWPENLFFSPEDELVNEQEWQHRMYGIEEEVSSDEDEQSKSEQWHWHHQRPPRQKTTFNFDNVANINSEDNLQEDDFSVRTDECTQVTKIKRQRRGKKAKNASMVGAFVTFSKALFGIGMLSNPAVLGDVGLILGTFCHLFIIVGCAFACYLLLMSRQIAKREVMMKQFEQQQQQQFIERKRLESISPIRKRMDAFFGKKPQENNSREQPQGVEASSGGYFPPMVSSSSRQKVTSNSIEMTPTQTRDMSKTPVHTNLSISTKQRNSSVTDDYQLMPSQLQSTTQPPPRPPIDSNTQEQPKVRLTTYGDVVKYLAGERASVFIIFTIVAVHLMFASGMVHLAVENLCYVIGMNRLGWSVVEEEILYDDDRANKFNYYHYTVNNDDYNNGGNNNDDVNDYVDNNYNNDDVNNNHNERYLNSGSSSHSGSGDEAWNQASQEEQMYLQWEGPVFTERLTMATMIFPIILVLLQIPSLRELATISSIGLITYAVGCIGTMIYVAVVKTSGQFQDHPEEMWAVKWSGIPTYVATTVYAIEGINLALPTVISVEGIQRMWMLKNKSTPDLRESTSGGGSEGGNNGGKSPPDLSVYIVCGAVFFYGFITLIVSWLGLAGGLGGGIGTIHEESGCPDVTYCLNSSSARFVYMLSLSIALILTLPVILYPSTEMLEIWLDEREEKRQKRREAALMSYTNEIDSSPPQDDAKVRRNLVNMIRQRSILQDRDDDETLGSPLSESSGSEMKDVNVELAESLSVKTEYKQPKKEVVVSPLEGDGSITSPSANKSNPDPFDRLNGKMRRVKYWKLRMLLAGTIIFIGTIEGSFPQVLKVAEVIRGVGLSIAGLIFPPLLYMSAVGGRFGTGMAAGLSLLVGLGLFNICLVLMSAFGGKDYIMEEGGVRDFYELDFD